MGQYYTDLKFFDNQSKMRNAKLTTNNVINQLIQADDTDFNVKNDYFKRKNPTLDELHEWFTLWQPGAGGRIPNLKKEVLRKLLLITKAKTTNHRRDPPKNKRKLSKKKLSKRKLSKRKLCKRKLCKRKTSKNR